MRAAFSCCYFLNLGFKVFSGVFPDLWFVLELPWVLVGYQNAQWRGAAAVWGEAEGEQLVQPGEEAAWRDLKAALQCCRKVSAKVEPMHSGVWWQDGETTHTGWNGRVSSWMWGTTWHGQAVEQATQRDCADLILGAFKTRQEKSPKQCRVWPHCWACFEQGLDRRQHEVPSSLNYLMDPIKERERKEKICYKTSVLGANKWIISLTRLIRK